MGTILTFFKNTCSGPNLEWEGSLQYGKKGHPRFYSSQCLQGKLFWILGIHTALQIRADQWSNLRPLTAHIYYVMIIVNGDFSKKSFYYCYYYFLKFFWMILNLFSWNLNTYKTYRKKLLSFYLFSFSSLFPDHSVC